ncbi:MAG TPA: VacJ family lipoprotein, partial [Burkholderiaceae bacterium]|nr:VacJ family lipoprotein [Burkholderiaceae bacterium]
GDAAKNVLRFGVNTLFGLGGCIDIASHMQGLQRQPEDFGQTLGRWGVGPGAYFVLPIFGPSTIRDTGGFFVDRLGEPLGTITCCTEYWVATGTRVVSLREGVLDATRAADQAALDRYLFYRDAYLQRRRFLIYDGNVPDEDGYPDDSYTAPPAGGRSAVDQQPPVTPPVNRLPR